MVLGNHMLVGVEVEFLLKSQESQKRTLIKDDEKCIDEQLATHSRTFNYELTKLQDVTL